jgi:hypothetical protein
MQMDDSDQLGYLTKYLDDQNIAHSVVGLTVYYRPWEFEQVVQGFAIPGGWVCFSSGTPERRQQLLSILETHELEYRKYPKSHWDVCFPRGSDEDLQKISHEYNGDDIPFSLKVKAAEFLPKLEDLFHSYDLQYRVTQFDDGTYMVWRGDRSQVAEIAKRAYEIQGDPN